MRDHCLYEMLPYFSLLSTVIMLAVSPWNLKMLARTCLMEIIVRHANGTSAVPADQCGKQTYIKQGKGYGGFKGISTCFAVFIVN